MKLLFLLLFVPTAFAASPVDWKKVKEDDGVLVYERQSPDSKVLDFKGEGFINATPAKILTVILDTTRAKEWVEDLEDSRRLRWVNEPFEYIEYNHVSTPFIIKDRDFVSDVRISKQPDGSALIEYVASTKDLPETKYVRGDITGSRFIIRPTKDAGKTWFVGEVHADPKGSVPKWIVNLFQRSWPVSTLNRLRAQVAKPDVKESDFSLHLFNGGAIRANH